MIPKILLYSVRRVKNPIKTIAKKMESPTLVETFFQISKGARYAFNNL